MTASYQNRRGKGAEMKIAFFGNNPRLLESVYSGEQRERLRKAFDVVPDFVGTDNFKSLLPDMKDVRAIFSTWGMPKLGKEQISGMPELEILFYGAGTVKGFAVPFFEKGIRISGGWKANGQVVAEFALGQILLACKGYFKNTRDYRSGKETVNGPGVYTDTVVALLGCGAVAKHLIRLLTNNFNLKILVYDPYLDAGEASRLGVVKSTLQECFQKAHVVSNHIPNVLETQNILDGTLFCNMRENATFINTGRSATVENEGFLKVFSERTDLTALLDVTVPEPLPEASPLFKIPNVLVSKHIAGAINSEHRRLGDRMIDHFFHWIRYGILRDEITMEMLDKMA